MIDMELAKQKGFDFGGATKFFDSAEPSKGVVADALDPNTAVPAYMSVYANPRVIEILTAKRNYKAIAPEVKNGDWSTAFTQFRALELTGTVTPYQDYDANGQANVNTNFPTRQQYRFQTTLRVGDLEQDVNAAARIDLFAEKQRSAATLLEISFNKYAFYGVENMNIYGLLNDPNLNADLTPTTGTAGNTWTLKTADEIMSDFAKMYAKLYERSNGWIDGNTRTKLVIAPAALAELNKVNAFGASVKKMLADTYPNMEILSAPEMVTGSGNLAMILADEVNGQPTVEFGYSEKYKAHSIIRDSSSMYQKISAGTYGAIVYMPFAIVTMLGV
jgi:hypothetical protein